MTRALTVERLREVLFYEPVTGAWTWLKKVGRGRVGSLAGVVGKRGYRVIQIDGKIHRSGRLAHLYMTGEWPANLIDHDDLGRSSDQWTNLREANNSQNGANNPLSAANTSGLKGVWWNRNAQKWEAGIKVGDRRIYLGLFDEREAGHAAYVAAAEKHFGEFARAA